MIHEIWFWLRVVAGVLIMVILVLFLIAPTILNVLNRYVVASNESPCLSVTDQTFQCRDYQFQQCIASERHTEDQCYQLIGGSGR